MRYNSCDSNPQLTEGRGVDGPGMDNTNVYGEWDNGYTQLTQDQVIVYSSKMT